MAAYNPGGSLVFAAALNTSQFNSGIQSMIAQMGFASKSAAGLDSSLRSIATIGFAAVVTGIGAITATIVTSTKAAAEWESQMMAIARVSIPNFDYSTPEGKAAFVAQSREFQKLYIDIPLKDRESLTKAAEPYALAGFEGESLYKLTEQTLKLVKATNYEITPDDVANMIIKSAQINRQQSGIDIKDSVQRTEKMTKYSNDVMDKVLAVANKYTISVPDLTNAIVEASGSAVLRGTANDIDSQLAFYALMNQYGIRPDLMRTALASSVSTAGLAGESTARFENALSKIGMQTRNAEGKKITEFSRAEVAAKLLGVTTSTYEKMAEENMEETQIKLLDAIENLNVDRLTKNAIGTGLFGSYAGREFAKLGAGGALETFREIQSVSKGSGGEVERYYQNTIQTFNDQWDLMKQRIWSIKEVLGEIFIGPVLNGVKIFSEYLKGTVQWLTKIVDSSRNLDGTVNVWKAIGKVVSDVKQKLTDLGAGDALKMTGAAASLALIALNLKTIGNVALLTVKPAFGTIATAILGLVGSIATVGTAIAGLAIGLAAIGYSLAPEKFTYFNQVASEALTGVSNLARQLYTDISTGDWGAAANHLKNAFTNAIVWIQGLNWNRLGGEIVTMIGDGASFLIKKALDLGGWIYDNLNTWVNSGGPYALGKSITNFILEGLKTLGNIDIWSIIKSAFKTINDWINLGVSIASEIGRGLISFIELPLARLNDAVLTTFANILSAAVGLGVDIANAITNAFSVIPNTLSGVESFINNISNRGSSAPYSTYVQDDGSKKYTIVMPDGSMKYANTRKEAQQIIDAAYGQNVYRIQSLSNKAPSDLSNALSEMNTIKTQSNTQKSVMLPVIGEYSGFGSEQLYDFIEWGKQQPILGDLLKDKSNEQGNTQIVQGNNQIAQGSEGSKNKLLYNNILSGNLISDETKKNMQRYARDKFIADMGGLKAPSVENKIAMEQKATEDKIAMERKATEDKLTMEKYGARESVNVLKDGIFQSSIELKKSSDYSSDKAISIADFVSSTTKKTTNDNAIITTDSYKTAARSLSSASIGVDESGRKIAVIGSVAQKQFENAGESLSNSTISGGVNNYNSVTSGGVNNYNSVTSGGVNSYNSMTAGGKNIEASADILAAKISSINIASSNSYGNGFNILGGFIPGLFSGSRKTSDSVMADILGSVASNILGGSIAGLFGGSQKTPDSMIVDNFADMTCTGQHVMVNALKYTDLNGKTTSLNPMDSQGIRSATNLEGSFNEMTCMGTTINIPGLKYTNPYGESSYLNPSEYISNGGILNYQKAGSILVDSARQSADYQKGSTNYHAQSMDATTQRWVTTNEIIEAQRIVDSVQSGTMWKNDIAFSSTAWAVPVNESTYNFGRMMDESYAGVIDWLGTEMTVNDKEYKQALETLELGKRQAEAMKEAASATDGAASKMESVGSNFASSFGTLLSQMSASFGNPSGAWGGTSIGGGGRYVGLGSTNPATAVPWGGTAASLIAQQQTANNYPFGSVRWGAKGSLIEEPTRLIAGEAGRELLLPNYLTELFLKLAALGFNSNSSGNNAPIVVNVIVDGEVVERVVSKRQKGNLNLRGLKLH